MFALEFLIVIDPDESFIKRNKSVYINMLVRHFCYLKILHLNLDNLNLHAHYLNYSSFIYSNLIFI